MKILACCSGGMDRSAGLKSALMVLGRLSELDVVTIGLNYNSTETKTMLFEWADLICVCGETALRDLIPVAYQTKVRHYDVGSDVYGSPHHWALINKFLSLLKTQPL